MPEGQLEQSNEDISRQFLDALEPMVLHDHNSEIAEGLKKKLETDLDDEWRAKLLTYTNPAQLARDLNEAGIADELNPGLLKAMFAFVRKRQNENAREKTERVLADREKKKPTRRERILSAVNASFRQSVEDQQLPLHFPEKGGAESLLDDYEFNELGKSCSMAMVVHMRDDGEVGFVSPYVPPAPPKTKEGLVGFWNESFKYDKTNQYFLFFMGGEWHTVNSADQNPPLSKEDLVKLWRESMDRRRQMH